MHANALDTLDQHGAKRNNAFPHIKYGTVYIMDIICDCLPAVSCRQSNIAVPIVAIKRPTLQFRVYTLSA